jgi:hypothetical protein
MILEGNKFEKASHSPTVSVEMEVDESKAVQEWRVLPVALFDFLVVVVLLISRFSCKMENMLEYYKYFKIQ